MPIPITSLPAQSTTELGDLFVMHNVAADRTKGISYQNLKNELQADINAVTQAQLTAAINNLTAAYQAADLSRLQLVFPVGSKICLSDGPNIFVNPATYLGFGTWVWEHGYYYMGVTAGIPIGGFVYGVGGTFGSFTHNHSGVTGSTTLNESQIPSHTHSHKDTFLTENISVSAGTLGENEALEYRAPGIFSGIGNQGYDYDNNVFFYKNRNTSAVGGTQAHTHTIANAEHLPPTMVESIWRRVA